jgi:hypothetical protein
MFFSPRLIHLAVAAALLAASAFGGGWKWELISH